MVVLSRGYWVLDEHGRIGYIRGVDYGADKTIARVCYKNPPYIGFHQKSRLTPLPEGLTPLLLSSNQQGELNE